MNEMIVRIFEACNFQDLTGQRITKVVRALSFIEERVDAMMGVWHKREFETMPLPPASPPRTATWNSTARTRSIPTRA